MLDSPRSCGGVSTPRSPDSVFGCSKLFAASKMKIVESEINCKEPVYHEAERDTSCSDTKYLPIMSCAASERLSINFDENDCKLLRGSQNQNVCKSFNDEPCMEEYLHKIAILEARLMAENYARNQQTMFMLEYEKRTHDWIAAKNKEVEDLKGDKISMEMKCNSLREQLEVVSRHLSATERSFNDVHEKYERAKRTVQVLVQNVQLLKHSLAEHEECIRLKHNQFLDLKEHAMDRLNQANVQLDLIKRRYSMEHSKLLTIIDEAETKVCSLSQELERKSGETAQLTRGYINLFKKLNAPSYLSLKGSFAKNCHDFKTIDDNAF